MLLGVHTGGGRGAEHCCHSTHCPQPPTTDKATLHLALRTETPPCKGINDSPTWSPDQTLHPHGADKGCFQPALGCGDLVWDRGQRPGPCRSLPLQVPAPANSSGWRRTEVSDHLQGFSSHMVGVTQTPPWLHLVPSQSSAVWGGDTTEQQEPAQGSGELGVPARATGIGGLVTLWVAQGCGESPFQEDRGRG